MRGFHGSVVLRQQTLGWREGNGPGGAGPRGVLVWHLQEFPTGPTRRRRKKEEEEEEEAEKGGGGGGGKEEEGLFKADAVNEEDPERDRATQV